MPRINWEEYKVLIELKNGWNWIARDAEGGLYVYECKPKKLSAFWFSVEGWTKKIPGNKVFQFIKWGDLEPYNVLKLIQEYEDSKYGMLLIEQVFEEETETLENLAELEEKEVKDTRWLKRDFDRVMKQSVKGDPEDAFDRGNLFGWEQARSTLHALVRQMDSPEIISPDTLYGNSSLGPLIAKEDLIEYFNSIGGHIILEKPTLPTYVIDFIDKHRGWAFYEIFDDDYLHLDHDDILKWLYDNDTATNRKRELDVALALEGYPYEEETEEKFYVMDSEGRMMLVRAMDGETITVADPFKLEDMYEDEKKAHQLTEREIKGYDERYWAFKQPIREE